MYQRASCLSLLTIPFHAIFHLCKILSCYVLYFITKNFPNFLLFSNFPNQICHSNKINSLILPGVDKSVCLNIRTPQNKKYCTQSTSGIVGVEKVIYLLPILNTN